MADTRILCVDPDTQAREELTEGLQTHLADLQPTVEARGTLETAQSVLTEQTVDCVITEYDLPDGTGLDLINRARTKSPDAGSILFTTAKPDAIDTTDSEATVTEYLAKDTPQAIERVAQIVRTTVTGRRQRSYPVPVDESDRIAALGTYAFDSAPLRHSLERLTALAVCHFDVSGAEVNIIEDHKQETLAAHEVAPPRQSTARDLSICTFTILEDDGVMAVEDVHDDPRFAPRSHELADRGVRSYLGATITAPTGFVLGTVCIYAEAPRTFGPADEDFLRTLADIATDLIELHSRLTDQAAPATQNEPGDAEGTK